MSLAPITLITDKSTAVIDNARRKLRQDESGLSLTVSVLNEDNTAYDLTGKNLVFCENKQNNKIIIDNGHGDNSGKFNRNSDNDTKGIFTYVLQEDIYAASGKAWFEITDGNTVDSTKNFYFDVEKDAAISVANSDYIGSLKALETAMAGVQSKVTSDLADMESQITKQIADDKAANEGEITQALKNLTDQTNVALSNVNEYTNKLATLQSQWDSELQSIKNQANTDTDSAVNAINDRYTNDFAQLKSDFANWQTSTTQNYQKQVDSILAKVQENGTEVADVQQQVDDTVAKMQTLTQQFSKVDFTVFAHRDDLSQGYIELPVEGSERQNLQTHDSKAISFKKPLVNCDPTLSKQYTAADASAVGQRINDLDTGLTQLNQEVYKNFDTKPALDLKLADKADRSDVTALQQQVSSQGTEITKKADSADVYTKSEINPMIEQAGKVKTVNGIKPDGSTGNIALDLSGYETKADAENALDNKADKSNVATLQDRIAALENKKPIQASSQDDAVSQSKNSNNEYYW